MGIAFRDWRYLYNALSENTDCDKKMDHEKLHTDVVEKYKLDPDDIESDADLGNLGEFLAGATIDAITVHINSASEVNVTLPVAREG